MAITKEISYYVHKSNGGKVADREFGISSYKTDVEGNQIQMVWLETTKKWSEVTLIKRLITVEEPNNPPTLASGGMNAQL